MELNEAYRRNAGDRDLDTTKIIPYYGVTYVFGSFNDSGDFEINKSLDDRLDRPRGVLAYPVNDMVGRRIKTSAMYVRLFRFKYHQVDTLVVSQYNEAKYKEDYQKILSYYIKEPDFVAVLQSLQEAVRSKETNVFARIWTLTRQVAKIDSEIQWETLLRGILGYAAIYDDRGAGDVILKKSPVLLVLNTDDLDTVEVIEILKDKPELNSHISSKIDRFNNLSSISNARRRIKN